MASGGEEGAGAEEEEEEGGGALAAALALALCSTIRAAQYCLVYADTRTDWRMQIRVLPDVCRYA